MTALGYESLPVSEGARHDELQPGTYSFRLNVPVEQKGVVQPINISVDALMLMYLMLYPKGAMKCVLQERPGLKRRVWKFLNQICPQTTLGEGRVYGGGLHKLEPKELGNVPAHTIAELLPRSAWPPRMQQAELFGDR